MTRHLRAPRANHSRLTRRNIPRSTITSWALANGPGSIGHRYDAYDHRCAAHSHDRCDAGSFPNEQPYHLDVARTGNELKGFNTSHLGFSQSTNLVRSAYGQAYRP